MKMPKFQFICKEEISNLALGASELPDFYAPLTLDPLQVLTFIL